MKVAIYVRVSRVDLNPENQQVELEKYAKAQGWEYQIFGRKRAREKLDL